MKKRYLKYIIPFAFLFYLVFITGIQAQNSILNDETGKLSKQEIVDLNIKLSELEKSHGIKMSLTLTKAIKTESVEKEASQLLASWKKEDSSGNAVVLIALKDRKIWIATDEKLSKSVTDDDKKAIVNKIIIPEMRSGRVAQGISKGMDSIVSLSQGNSISKTSTFNPKNYPILSILIVLVALSFLSGFIKTIRIKLALAVGVAVIFWLIFGSITYSILMLVLSLFSLLGRSTRGGGGAYGGGYNEGTEGAGGNSSDSSFSLGGGSFIGGGASGDWRAFSFDTHKKFIFTDEQKSNVEQAVKDLELESSGEIVVYFGRNSDAYQQGSWKLATTLGLLGLVSIMSLSYLWLLPPTFSIMNMAMSIFLLMVSGLVISYFFPTVRLAFVPLNVMDHRVITRARDIFLQEEIFNTVDRTGILIYISEMEKRVQVLGDQGISSVIEQSDWNNVLKLVTDGIKQGSPAEGLVSAIHECKKLLLENGFIVRTDDTNELSDKMIIEK
ncbi:TPM domain-containing protein [Reichenbachiella sp. MALMAid0571]|uniref:TPM domain-containing protein n=1 Tax=Reichenbachiella sp. MALMAid0571 TaxID=3143939 RepID=UPI0032DF5717